MPSNTLDNFFASARAGEAILGSDTYWCGYVKNDNTVDTLKNVVLFFDSNTQSEDDEVKLALGTSGKNGTEQTITTINTAPTGVEWSLAPSYNQGIFVGDLAPGDKYAFWLWRHINASTKEQVRRNKFELVLAFDPPAGSSGGSGSGSGGGGGGPAPGPTPADSSIAVTADWSLSSDASETVDNIVSFDPDMTVTPGDLSYTDSGQEWADITAPLRANGKHMKLAWGNHDAEEGTPQPELTNFYKELMGINEPNRYYVHTMGNVFMIFIDCYTSFGVGSTQYNYIKAQLEQAKTNSTYTWRMAFFHEPMYTSPSNYSATTSLRNAYHPLFVANNVDFAFNGHNHNYCRSFPLAFNSGSPSSPTLVQNGNEPNYTNFAGQATMFMQVGTAGRSSHRSFDSQASYIAYQQDSEYGFVLMELSNGGKTMTGKFYKNSGSALMDTFTVVKT